MKQLRFGLCLFTSLLIIFSAQSCADTQKKKELDYRERELNLKEKELSLKSPTATSTSPKAAVRTVLSTKQAVAIAESKFEQYAPKIERSHNAILDLRQSYTGDFTGDGIEDVAIYFSLSPKEGGNALLGQGLSLYQNTGEGVKVIAGFEPDYLFSFSRISRGHIYVDQLEYAKDDGACCPSIKTERTLTIVGSTVY